MPLESTMLCLDNSEWMRNGDYIPSRLEAQHDAANVLCGAKIQSNPESTVGVLTMGGNGVEVLVSPTEDMGKILGALHQVPIGGSCQLNEAIQIAQLALKHRKNKKGGQRIVIFVGSPIEDTEKDLTKLGKSLKKNNVSVDIISMGEVECNTKKLESFIDAANSSNNCHLLNIPAGMLPSDALVSSPIIHGEDASGGVGETSTVPGASAAGSFADYGGIDPSIDPELALALKVSMEEERVRQEAMAKKNNEAAKSPKKHDKLETNVSSTNEMASNKEIGDKTPKKVLQKSQNEKDEEDNVDIQQALNMSLEKNPVASENVVNKVNHENNNKTDASPAPAPAFLDPNFVNSLLSGLPSVDPNDPLIQQAIEQISKSSKDDTKEERKKE